MPYKTHIIPRDLRNVIVYDHVAGFHEKRNCLLVVPDFGSITTFSGEISILLNYFSDIYVYNPRIFAPYYKSTVPVHSKNTKDIEYLVMQLKVNKLLAIGDGFAVREYSKTMLEKISIARIPIEMTAFRLEEFSRDRSAHLAHNKYLDFNNQERQLAEETDCFQYRDKIDEYLSGNQLPQHGGSVKIFNIQEKINAQGGFMYECAGLVLNE